MSYDISNDIYIGSLGASALFHFTNSDIVLNSLKGIFNVDMIGNELPVDTFTVTIRYDPSDTTRLIYGTSDGNDYLTSNGEEYLLKRITARDFLMSVPYGTVVWWYCDGTLRAKGYASEIKRVGKYAYTLKCISGVGLLTDKIHVGGLYSGETFGAVCAEIVDGTFAYTISANVAAVRVYGHLPYDSARNNLHRLLFSAGAVLIRKNEYEDYNIQFLGQNMLTIPDSRVALGGSVSYELPSNRAEITEHGFFQTPGDEEVVLYDNSGEQAVDNLTVLFQQAPAYSVTASGNLTINELSVNHAIVSGTGTLTGKIYTHTRQVFVLAENPQNNPERTRRVETNELVNTLNSRFVAQRILAYFMRSRIIKSKILLQTEVPGSYVQMNDAYGDPFQGYIQQMEFMPTSLKAANCQIAEGFTTDAYGNTFTKRQIFTYSQYGSDYVQVRLNFDRGKTTVIRLVLIGAGDGGQAGYDGEDGGDVPYEVTINDNSIPDGEQVDGWGQYAMFAAYNDSNPDTSQPTPQGGAAGQPGSPGKIYVYDIDVSFLTPLQSPNLVMSLFLGTPGDGGASDGAIGSSGGETVVGVAQPLPDGTRPVVWLSSADGVQIDNGWSDIMTGDVYLLPGADGVKGGNGGRVDTVSDKGVADYAGLIPYTRRKIASNPIRGIGAQGLPGESVQNGNGGAGGDGYGYDGTILEWREPNAGGYTVHQWFKGYNFWAERNGPYHASGATGAALNVLYPQAASGGGGGGGAYGANGSPGSAPVMERYGGDIFTGNGGNGANALPPPDAGIGCGGAGGNGGGAGGNGGGGYTYGVEQTGTVYEYGLVNYQTGSGTVGGKGGQGGAGSRGGRGGDGALIIYY